MQSYQSQSHHYSNSQQIAADLLTAIPEFSAQGTLGILICDTQIDAASLAAELAQRVSFPIVGGSTLVVPSAVREGDISATLTVMSREGLSLSVGVSPVLQEGAHRQQVSELVQRCRQDMTGDVKLWMPFLPLMANLAADPFIHSLFELAGDTPVFGGVTTNDLESTQAQVFAEGQAYTDRMVLLALGGTIQPVFGVANQLTILTDYAPTVTASEGNIVQRVDDMPLTDYMRSIGIKPEDRINGVDALVQYGPLPARLSHKLDDDDGVAEIRCISYTDLQDGSAAFSSAMPLGTRFQFGVLHRHDVLESSQHCLGSVLEQIKQREAVSDYRYGAILSVPCVARYFALLGNENPEHLLFTSPTMTKYVFSSYYGFCEIAPTLGQDGAWHNRSHNASIVICAL